MRTGMNFVRRVAGLVRMSQMIVIGVLLLGLISCAYPPKQRGGIEPYPGWAMASQAQGRHRRAAPPREESDSTLRSAVPCRFEGRVAEGSGRGLRQRRRTLHDLSRDSHEDVPGEERPSSIEVRGVPRARERAHRQQRPGGGQDPQCQETRAGPAIGDLPEMSREGAKEVTPPHVAQWRTSVHAHKDVSCSDCHRAHHDAPQGNSDGHASSGNVSSSRGQAGAETPQPGRSDPLGPPRGRDSVPTASPEPCRTRRRRRRSRRYGERRGAWRRPRPTSVIAVTRAHIG